VEDLGEAIDPVEDLGEAIDPAEDLAVAAYVSVAEEDFLEVRLEEEDAFDSEAMVHEVEDGELKLEDPAAGDAEYSAEVLSGAFSWEVLLGEVFDQEDDRLVQVGALVVVLEVVVLYVVEDHAEEVLSDSKIQRTTPPRSFPVAAATTFPLEYVRTYLKLQSYC